jgi:hypothetical protein
MVAKKEAPGTWGGAGRFIVSNSIPTENDYLHVLVHDTGVVALEEPGWVVSVTV